MYKKIVSKLVSTNGYFNQQKCVIHSRALGINEHGFRCDDNFIQHRENVWYFSNEFETILLNYGKHSHLPIDIEKIFHLNKDKLKDLSWIVVDYY